MKSYQLYEGIYIEHGMKSLEVYKTIWYEIIPSILYYIKVYRCMINVTKIR